MNFFNESPQTTFDQAAKPAKANIYYRPGPPIDFDTPDRCADLFASFRRDGHGMAAALKKTAQRTGYTTYAILVMLRTIKELSANGVPQYVVVRCRITADTVARIRAMIQEGKTRPAICQELGLTEHQVNRAAQGGYDSRLAKDAAKAANTAC